MKEPLLNELDDRLSTIKRWGIVKTIQQQSVAEHCFNVQRICMRLAPLFNIDHAVEQFILSQAALHHDNKEALTGDIPSTAKGYTTIGENGVDTDPRGWYTGASDEIKAIVKLADMLEMFHFMAIEMKMGNRYIRNHKIRMQRAINKHIAKHPEWPETIHQTCRAWMAWVEVSVSETFE
jgi:5'-deoxynucleotidase YfbR-like HD superfamily hydrolase